MDEAFLCKKVRKMLLRIVTSLLRIVAKGGENSCVLLRSTPEKVAGMDEGVALLTIMLRKNRIGVALRQVQQPPMQVYTHEYFTRPGAPLHWRRSGTLTNSWVAGAMVYDWIGRWTSKVVSNWIGSAWVNLSEERYVYENWKLIAILDSLGLPQGTVLPPIRVQIIRQDQFQPSELSLPALGNGDAQ